MLSLLMLTKNKSALDFPSVLKTLKNFTALLPSTTYFA
jgi:hypothetical protein